jgi:hypothetical protein
MTRTLYSSVECADRLGVPLHRIAYAQRIGRLPKPSRLVAGKAIYSAADLRKMAKVFGVELPGRGVVLPKTEEVGGPYSVRQSGSIGQEVVGPSGTVVAWTLDPVLAARIVKVLTENQEPVPSASRHSLTVP